jgi:hypothetical protein
MAEQTAPVDPAAQHPLVQSESVEHESAQRDWVPKLVQNPDCAWKLQHSELAAHGSPAATQVVPASSIAPEEVPELVPPDDPDDPPDDPLPDPPDELPPPPSAWTT